MDYFLENIKEFTSKNMLFHLNDSKEPCGGIGHGIDRHWEIYHGKIDPKCFEKIIKTCLGKNKVFIV